MTTSWPILAFEGRLGVWVPGWEISEELEMESDRGRVWGGDMPQLDIMS